MARLRTGGADTLDISSVNSETRIEGITRRVSSSTITTDTSIFRSGLASFKFATDSSGNSCSIGWLITGSTSTTYYFRAYIYFSVFPSGSTRIAIIKIVGGGDGYQIGFNRSTHGLTLENSTGTQIGSESSALSTGVWYRVEFKFKGGTGSNDIVELQLDGQSVASTSTGTNLAAAPDTLDFGWINGSGANSSIYFDDCALNDSAGSVQNSYPGSEKVVLAKPISDNSTGSWRAGSAANASANGALFNGIDNTPPVGTATPLAVTAGISNAISGATNPNGDFNMTTYSSLGIVSGDTINTLQMVIVQGEDISTGTKTGTYKIQSNPAVGTTDNVSDGGSNQFGPSGGGAVGTYPTNWIINRGTAFYPAPVDITLGNSPVCRITKTDTGTRAADLCFIGLYISYTPNPGITTNNISSGSSVSTPKAGYKVLAAAIVTGSLLFNPVAKFRVTTPTISNSINLYTQSTKHNLITAHRSSSVNFFTPTVAHITQFVTSSSISNSVSLFNLTSSYRLNLPAKSSSTVLFGPSENYLVSSQFIGSGSTTSAPVVRPSISSPFISLTNILYPATRLDYSAISIFRPSSVNLLLPTTKYNIISSSISNANTINGHVINPSINTQSINSTSNLYSVLFSFKLSNSTIVNPLSVYNPTIKYVVVSDNINNTVSIFPPITKYSLTTNHVSSSSPLFTLLTINRVSSSNIGSSIQVFSPLVDVSQSIELSSISNSSNNYSISTELLITGSLLSNQSILYFITTRYAIIFSNIDNSSALNNNGVVSSVINSTITNTSQLYSLSTYFRINNTVIQNTSSLNNLILSQHLVVDNIDSSLVVHAPQFEGGVLLVNVPSTTSIHSSRANSVVTTSSINNIEITYSAIIRNNIGASLLNNINNLYASRLTSNILSSTRDSTSSIFNSYVSYIVDQPDILSSSFVYSLSSLDLHLDLLNIPSVISLYNITVLGEGKILSSNIQSTSQLFNIKRVRHVRGQDIPLTSKSDSITYYSSLDFLPVYRSSLDSNLQESA